MIQFSPEFASAAAALKPLPVPLPPVTIAWARDLPALPAAVLELLALVAAEDVDLAELSAKLSVDMALTAKILRLANSAFYGLRREVTSVGDAVSMLGLRLVKGLVTAAALGGALKPPPCKGFDFDAFWRHGVATAVAAQMIGFAVDADSEASFTAGLLFRVGRLILAGQFPDRYAALLEEFAATGKSLEDLEAERLGVSAAEVGMRVANLWRFPDSIATAIGASDRPLAAGAAPTLGQIVSAADRLVSAEFAGTDLAATAAGSAAAAWNAAGISPDFWTTVASSAATQTDAICAGLKG